MRKLLFFSFLTLTFLTQAKNFEYAGYLKSEVWSKINNDNSHLFLSSFKNTFDLETEFKLSENLSFFFHPRFFYDFAYEIRNQDVFDKNEDKMVRVRRTYWLRDCYLDYTSDKLDVRIGKQQVVWGQTDGFPILDRVQPFDLTYFWLPDFADIRIPLWMIKIEYSPQLNSTLQFLLIPDYEASRAAQAGAPFSFKARNEFEAVKDRYGLKTRVEYPAQKFRNSRIGLRWRSMIEDFEYSLHWLYGYSTGTYTYQDDAINYVKRAKLMHLIGFAFNKTFLNPGLFQGLTIRGEFAYLHNEPAYYGTEGSRKLTERTDKYLYALALERTFFTNWLFSFQFIQYIHNERTKADKSGNVYQVLDKYTYGVMDKVENIFTLKVVTDFMHERLKPEILIIYLDDNDGRVCFKTKYELRDNIWLTLGYYHFWGPPRGQNGQFRNNDHIVFEVKYTF